MGAKCSLPSPTPTRAVTGLRASRLARYLIYSPCTPFSQLLSYLAFQLSFPNFFSLSVLAGERGRLRSRLLISRPRAPRPQGISHHPPLSISRGSFPAPAKCRASSPLPTLSNSVEKDLFSIHFYLFSQSLESSGEGSESSPSP